MIRMPAVPPLTAQIVGLSMWNRTVGGVLRKSRLVGLDAALMPPPSLSCLRSRPAQNARPMLVRITQRTAGSSFALISTRVSSFRIGPQIAFMRSGAFSVISAMLPSSISQRTSNNNAVMMLDKSRRYYYHAMPITSVVEDNRVAKSNFDTSLYVDIIGAIADRDGKVPVFTPDKKFISQDRTHHRAALDRDVGPQRRQRLLEAGRAVDYDEFGRFQSSLDEIVEQRPPGGLASELVEERRPCS